MNDERGAVGPLTLLLGGGGVRGLAHLGVLSVLEENDVRPEAIVGVSAGAIVGAMYALEPDAAALRDRILNFLESSAFRRLNLRFELESKKTREAEGQKGGFFERLVHGLRRQLAMELLFRRPSIFGGEILRRLVFDLVPDASFEDCRVPFRATALDLISGEEVVLESGGLRDAVVASSSVPGFFPPLERDGRLLTDAGMVDNMPVAVARRCGAGPVIGVSLNARVAPMRSFPTGIDVIFRSEEIGTKLVNDRTRLEADVVIEPDVAERYWLDFSDLDRVIESGAQATRAVVDRIRRLPRGAREA